MHSRMENKHTISKMWRKRMDKIACKSDAIILSLYFLLGIKKITAKNNLKSKT